MPTAYLRAVVKLLFIAAFCFGAFDIHAQATIDTNTTPDIEVVKEKKGSIFKGRPGKSLLLSLALPGAGQIYNKSYLRVPFVWGAVGGMGYVLVRNTQLYECRRDLYIAKLDGTPLELKHKVCKQDENLLSRSPEIVRIARDNANSQRQLAIIGFTLVWLANGVDAFVDAHLKEFDIDEDLSIDFGPRMDDDLYAPMRVGVFVQF